MTTMKMNKKLFQVLISFTILVTLYLVTRQWIHDNLHDNLHVKHLPVALDHRLRDHVLILKSSVNVLSVTHSHTKSTIQPPRSTRSINVLSRNIHTLVDIKHLQRHRFSGFGNGSIPRIVHVTYKSSNIPTQYEGYLRHCLAINPDVAFLFWTDAHAEEFVKQAINENGREEERSLHKKLSTYSGLEKADVFRNMLLYYIGGVYMDLDMECKVSFNVTFLKLAEEMAKKYNATSYSSQISCMVDQEQWMQTRIRWLRKYCPMNNFMICRPQHPFFRHMVSNLKEDDKSGDIMSKTGPFLLTRRFEEYQTIWEKSANSTNMSSLMTNKLEIANHDWFSPIVDYVEMYAGRCNNMNQNNEWFKQGCKVDLPHYRRTLTERVKNAFLIHRFLHLGYSFSFGLLKKFVPIQSFSGIYVVSLV